MKHASLFSGIGGFDLAAQWMGWENTFQVEKDEFCQKVLTKNFPHAKRYGDIKQFDGTSYRGAIDILTGGFPCQPYSTAGKRKGKEDERHLWPEMLRVIREVQPAYVVGENVHGLVNWSGGLVFDEVQANLEAEGFEVTSVVLPAAGVNAPHRRERIWFIAYSCSNGHAKSIRHQRENRGIFGDKRRVVSKELKTRSEFGRRCETIADSVIWRSQRREVEAQGQNTANGNPWSQFPTQSPVCGGNDGIPNRVDRIKSLGNAIVPQVAFEIFKAIEQTMK